LVFITSNKPKLHSLQIQECTEFSECLPSFGRESFVFRLLSTNIQIEIQRNRILPVVLYGCETWAPKLGGGNRLRVLESRVLRRIIRPEEEEATGEWRKLHNEQLHHLFCSPYIIHFTRTQRMRWVGHVTCVCVGGGQLHTAEFCCRNLKGRDHLEDLGIDRIIILKWILRK
jgi:hypothetical protein